MSSPSHRSSRLRRPGGPFRYGLQLCRRHAGRRFDRLVGLQVLDALSLVLVVHSGATMTSALLRDHGRVPHAAALLGPGALLIAGLVVSGLCAACAPALQTVLGEHLAAATALDVLAAAGSLSLADFDQPDVLDRLKRVEQGTFIRPAQLAFGLGITLSGLVGAVALAVGVLTLAPWLALFAVAAAAPLWWAAQRDGAHTYRTVRGLSRLERRRMYLAGLLTRREHAAEVRAFDLAPVVTARYHALSEQRLAEVAHTARGRTLRQLTARAAGGLLLLAGVGVLATLVAAGRVPLAAAIATGAAGAALRTRLADAASGIRQMQEAAEFLDDHRQLLADCAPPTAASPGAGPVAASPAEPLTEVELRGVTVQYPGMSRPALADVDLRLRVGRVVALVGRNGSGKSTLAMVAAGLREPTRGAVLVNGRAVPAGCWRSQTSVLLQDAGRYQETVRDNVAFGDVHRPVDEARVRRAVEEAGGRPVLDVVGGLDAAIGSEQSGGIELSGGQWQRVALARVFYRDSRLLVLDEPSAPLDPLAEHDLVRRLHRSFGDRAVLLVTHRMSAAACADEVIVLDRGRVVERGAPAELLRAGGRFAELRHAEQDLWRPDGQPLGPKRSTRTRPAGTPAAMSRSLVPSAKAAEPHT